MIADSPCIDNECTDTRPLTNNHSWALTDHCLNGAFQLSLRRWEPLIKIMIGSGKAFRQDIHTLRKRMKH